MKLQKTLLNRHDADGLEEVVAEHVHGHPSLTPEEMMILREEMEENRRAAMDASKTDELDYK